MGRKAIPKSVREKVYQKFNGHCAYCGCELAYKDMQVDHIKSVCGYGDNNNIDNLFPSCRMCNFYKGISDLEYFRKSLETLHERLRKPFIYRLALKYGLITEKKNKIVFYFEKEKEQ